MATPGTRGSRDNELNFIDIILAIGIKPLATFLKGRKTAAGAVAAILAYASPLRDMAAGSEYESALNLLVAVLEFAAVWLGGGGAVSGELFITENPLAQTVLSLLLEACIIA